MDNLKIQDLLNSSIEEYDLSIHEYFGSYRTKIENILEKRKEQSYWGLGVFIIDLKDCKNFENVPLIIGCKCKNITDWDLFFDENCTKEHHTPRNTNTFNRIKSEYFQFRKFIEDVHKIIHGYE